MWEVWESSDFEGWHICQVFDYESEAREFAREMKCVSYADMEMGLPEMYYSVRRR